MHLNSSPSAGDGVMDRATTASTSSSSSSSSSAEMLRPLRTSDLASASGDGQQDTPPPSESQFVTSPTFADEGADVEDDKSATPVAAPSQKGRFRPWRQRASSPANDGHLDSSTTPTRDDSPSRPISTTPSSHHSSWLSRTKDTTPLSSASESPHAVGAESHDSNFSWTGMLKGMVHGHADTAATPPSSAGHSRHPSKDYKETLDAHTKDEKDGTRFINQYHLVEVIGHGTYGTVYKGLLREDPSQLFAVKEFSKTRLKKSRRHETARRPPMRGRPSGGLRGRGIGHTPSGSRNDPAPSAGAEAVNQSPSSKETDPLQLIRREIAIMKKLDHPNLITLLEALDDPSRDELYMVLEFCPDGPVIDVKLHERTQPLTEEVARDYFIQILLGIEYLHHNDIIHRDIKPDNILLCEQRKTCKIVDFGVSEMFDQAPTDTRPKGQGTPAFLSPELCSASGPKPASDKDAAAQRESGGRRDDMWALGVTLYCMVVGHLPFDKSQFLELYEAIKTEEPEYPSHLSPQCVKILKHFLAKDPSKRINSVSDARHAPWLSQDGEKSLVSAADNLKNAIYDVTEAEIQSAIVGVSSVWAVARAVSKFKLARNRSSMRSASTQSQSSDAGAGTGGSYLPDETTTQDSPMQSPRLLASPAASRSNTLASSADQNDKDESGRGGEEDGSGDGAGNNQLYRPPHRPQSLSRSASSAIPDAIPEEDSTAMRSTVAASINAAASTVYDSVASVATAVVPQTVQSTAAAAVGKTSSSSGDGSVPDALREALQEIEKVLEDRMRKADPTAATKHLANAIQQYPPLERLRRGLKGMNLNLFGWADAGEDEQQKASRSQSGTDEPGSDDGEKSGTPRADDSTPQKEGSWLSARRMQEDGSGTNVHTGRRTETGSASSAVSGPIKARHRRGSSTLRDDGDDNDDDGPDSDFEKSVRIFEGPLVGSPRRDEEYVSRAAAARDLVASRGQGRQIPDADNNNNQSASSKRSGDSKSYGGNLEEGLKHENIDDTVGSPPPSGARSDHVRSGDKDAGGDDNMREQRHRGSGPVAASTDGTVADVAAASPKAKQKEAE